MQCRHSMGVLGCTSLCSWSRNTPQSGQNSGTAGPQGELLASSRPHIGHFIRLLIQMLTATRAGRRRATGEI